MGYVYQADTYCNDCGNEIRKELANSAPEDPLDHHSYDSDDYPKDANLEREEADIPQHCAKCGEFLHNPLTSEGYKYVQSALNEFRTSVTSLARFASSNHPHLAEWGNWYGFTYWTDEDCKDDGRHDRAGWYSSEAY